LSSLVRPVIVVQKLTCDQSPVRLQESPDKDWWKTEQQRRPRAALSQRGVRLTGNVSPTRFPARGQYFKQRLFTDETDSSRHWPCGWQASDGSFMREERDIFRNRAWRSEERGRSMAKSQPALLTCRRLGNDGLSRNYSRSISYVAGMIQGCAYLTLENKYKRMP